MPQIYAILDPHLADNYCKGDGLDVFFQTLKPVIEKRFGIEGADDIAITVVSAVRTVGEANVQIEIRYTAGTDEYKKGRPFDPSLKTQEDLIEDIHQSYLSYRRQRPASQALKISVWCKPYYNSAFKTFE